MGCQSVSQFSKAIPLFLSKRIHHLSEKLYLIQQIPKVILYILILAPQSFFCLLLSISTADVGVHGPSALCVFVCLRAETCRGAEWSGVDFAMQRT